MGIVMLIGFIFGTIGVVGGGFAIRRGDTDAGKLSIIGGLIIAGAPVIVKALFTAFGLDGRPWRSARSNNMSATSKHELRFTETNSADDSAGKTWGLEGNLFWYLVGGSFASVLTLLLLFSVWRWSLLRAPPGSGADHADAALHPRVPAGPAARLRHRPL